MTALQKNSVYFIFVLLVAIILLPTKSFAETAQQLQTRINQLEKQMQTMSRAVYRGEKTRTSDYTPDYGQTTSTDGVESTLAHIEIRISDIEKQLRLTTGQLERNQHENRQLKQRLDTLEAGLSQGQPFQKLKTSRTAPVRTEPSATTSTTLYAVPQNAVTYTARPATQQDLLEEPTTQTTLNLPSGGSLGVLKIPADSADMTPAMQPTTPAVGVSIPPEQAYELAYTYIRDGKYKEAATEFTDFLTNHPKSKLSANAQYWLAETFYVRGKYPDAAKMFAKGYELYPKSSKTSDNLLKLGLSLSKSGKKQDACLTFSQLQKEFPNKTGMIAQRRIQEQKRLECDSM